MKITKKFITFFLSFALIFSLLPISDYQGLVNVKVSKAAEDIQTSGTCGTSVNWTLTPASSGYKLTLSGSGAMSNYNIVSTGVSSAPWAKVATNITSIVIGSGITSIGSYAFYNCSSCTSISIPGTVTSIGSYSLYGMSSLPSITLPTGLTSIGTYGMANMTKIPSLGLSKLTKLTSVGGGAFYNDLAITDSVNITSAISWGSGCFTNCRAITTATIKSGVETLSATTFSGCTALTTVTFESGCKSIGTSAFEGCSSLNKVTLPSTLTTIGSSSFYGCDSLTSITLPTSLVTISSSAFKSSGISGALNLSGLSNLVSIGDHAYMYSDITSVILPANLKSIGNNPFYYATHLESIKVVSGNTNFTVDNNILYKVEGGKKTAAVSLPYTVMNNSNFKTLTMADGITEISPYAFAAGSFSAVEIPNTVTSIGNYAFYNGKLTSVDIPSSVTYVGSNAFAYNANMISVTVPASVKSFGNYTFANCSSLTDVDLADEITSIGSYMFSTCKNLSTIKLPANLTSIGSYAFNSSGLTALELPSKVKTLDNCAFMNCSKLSSINLNESLTNINQYCFSSCTKLTNVTIPDSVTSVGNQAFSQCSTLKTVNIGKGVKTVATCFIYDSVLDEINIDAENPNIELVDGVIFNKAHTELMFYPLTKPDESYHMPETTTILDSYAINNNHFLKELFVSSKVTTLNKTYAISNNSKLKNIYFQGDAPTLSGTSIIYKNFSELLIYTVKDSTGWDAGFWTEFEYGTWDPSNTDYADGDLPGFIHWEYRGMNGSLTLTYTGEEGNDKVATPDYETTGGAPWDIYDSGIQTLDTEGINIYGANLMYEKPSLTRVLSDDNLTTIKDQSFMSCPSLIYVVIPTVQTIGTKAFCKDYALTNGIYLETVKNIGDEAFKECTSLESITLGDHITTLPAGIFEGCLSLTATMIPESITTIGERAFKDCDALHSVNIPASVTSIGNEAFAANNDMTKAYFYGKIPSDWSDTSFADHNASLIIYYRKANADNWLTLDGKWNEIPVVEQGKFYTEKKDHYSFANTGSSFGYEKGYCIPRYRYLDLLACTRGSYFQALEEEWGGSCFGMSATTLEFYENSSNEMFDLKKYDKNATTLYDIAAPRNKKAELTKLIELYQISQFVPEVTSTNGYLSKHLKNYSGLIKKIEEFERSGGLSVDSKAEPIIMCLYSSFAGHAVIPTAVSQNKLGEYLVTVYDPNYPDEFKTITIDKRMRNIKYGSYNYASYISYDDLTAAMHTNETIKKEDNSLYLTVDKSDGIVINAEGKGIDKIDGAYKQQAFSGDENTSASSFVVPGGDEYSLGKDDVVTDDEKSEETKDDSKGANFKVCNDNLYCEIQTDDNETLLTIDNSTPSSMQLTLESDEEETSSAVKLMNEDGMERELEITGGDAQISVDNNDNISIQAIDDNPIVVKSNGKVLSLDDGSADIDYEAGEDESPLTVSDVATDISLDSNNCIYGTVNAGIVMNRSQSTKATVTATFYDAYNNNIGSYTAANQRLDCGYNSINLNIDDLDTFFTQSSGEAKIYCKVSVLDKYQNRASKTSDFITVTITSQDEATKAPAATKVPAASAAPTNVPTTAPTVAPTKAPTAAPTKVPTAAPSNVPTAAPSEAPTTAPTKVPLKPTLAPKPTPYLAVPPTKLGLKRTSATIGVKEKLPTQAIIYPANASDKTIYYSSTDLGIAYVYGGGDTWGVKPGNAIITMKTVNGLIARLNVTVKNAPSSVKISKSKLPKKLKVKKTYQLKVSVNKGSACSTFSYKSSNKKIAKVYSSGKVKFLKKGTVKITVTTYNGKKATIKLVGKK